MEVGNVHLDAVRFVGDLDVTFTVDVADAANNTAEEKVSDTVLTFSPTSNITSGKLAIVFAVMDNVDTTSSDDTTKLTVTDTDGHTWTRAAEGQLSSGGALDGLVAGIYYTITTTTISTSDTITITAIANATAKGGHLSSFNIGGGSTVSVAGKAYQRVTATGTYTVTLSGLAGGTEYLWIGTNAHESSDGGTNNVDTIDFTQINHAGVGDAWGTSGGSDVSARAGYRIATETTNTYNTSGNAVTDRVSILVAFQENAAVGGATILDPFGMRGFFGA